jgi:SAM-dependent methyltransferase
VKRFDRLLQRWRIAQVAPLVGKDARVLDIGCADGELLKTVPGIAHYVGVDPDVIPSSSTRVRFVRDVFPTPQIPDDERFDVISALAVLEHVPRQAQTGFARACARHLAPNGMVAITVPSPIVDSILTVLKGVRLIDGMHEEEHYGYDPAATATIFEPHGLRLLRHRRFELGLNHLFVFQRSAG